MNISTSLSANASYSSQQVKSSNIEIKTQEDAQELKAYMQENSITFSSINIDFQSSVSSFNSNSTDFEKDHEEFQNFLQDVGYNGPNIGSLSQEEATELVSEDGFFGIDKTSQRIADFVLSGAGEDESLLRAGRAGILQGFDEAKQISGGELPDISYKTIEKAVEIIDKAMHSMGYSILDSNS
jgi:hypothetical protein